MVGEKGHFFKDMLNQTVASKSFFLIKNIKKQEKIFWFIMCSELFLLAFVCWPTKSWLVIR